MDRGAACLVIKPLLPFPHTHTHTHTRTHLKVEVVDGGIGPQRVVAHPHVGVARGGGKPQRQEQLRGVRVHRVVGGSGCAVGAVMWLSAHCACSRWVLGACPHHAAGGHEGGTHAGACARATAARAVRALTASGVMSWGSESSTRGTSRMWPYSMGDTLMKMRLGLSLVVRLGSSWAEPSGAELGSNWRSTSCIRAFLKLNLESSKGWITCRGARGG